MSRAQAFAALRTAVSFHEAAIRAATKTIDPETRRVDTPAVAGLTMAAFAAELYLKALILQRQRTITGHDLHRLYSEHLEPSERAEIAKRYEELHSSSEGQLIEHLSTIKDTFAGWRYIYELEPGDQVDAGSVFNFTRACYLVAREINPRWRISRSVDRRVQSPPPFHFLMCTGGGKVALTTLNEPIKPQPFLSEGKDNGFDGTGSDLILDSKAPAFDTEAGGVADTKDSTPDERG